MAIKKRRDRVYIVKKAILEKFPDPVETERIRFQETGDEANTKVIVDGVDFNTEIPPRNKFAIIFAQTG